MKAHSKYLLYLVVPALLLVAGYVWASANLGTVSYLRDGSAEIVASSTNVNSNLTETPEVTTEAMPVAPTLDTIDYDKRLLALANFKPPALISVLSTSTDSSGVVIERYSTTTPPSPLRYSSSTNVTVAGKLWPKTQPYPLPGAILPFKRIIAYYGNFYSTRMGILGELEPEEVLAHLADIQAKWEVADPNTPVMPAIEYIAMVAQADAGADGMYRAVMPDAEIEKAYAMAQKINGILILDIQVGLSPLSAELPKFKKFLERPEVHFALDPEFSMKGGQKPGTVIGSFSAADINYTIDYMSKIVRDNNLPPKVLLVHRFTQNMMTNAEMIKATPEVQVVIVMDGWGSKDLKRGTYKAIIEPEPVQFAGIKVFYKNDLKAPSTGIFTPQEILDLNPVPIYVQYQ
jgi:hypothetical protein